MIEQDGWVTVYSTNRSRRAQRILTADAVRWQLTIAEQLGWIESDVAAKERAKLDAWEANLH